MSRPFARGVTVDGPLSRDLDDAIWIEKTPDGWTIEVSIADVASSVMKGDPLDLQALEMGFTRYFATGNKPMLPRHLADGELSLLPGPPRKTFTFITTLDAGLHPTGFRIVKTRFRNRRKLTYAYVDGCIENEADRYHAWWRTAFELAQGLLNRRREKGALVIFDLKKGLLTNEDGEVERMPNGEFYRAYLIVQEMMILTNRLLSEFLLEQGVTFLLRNHTTRANELRDTYLAQMSELLLETTPEMLARVNAEARHLMNRARYGSKNVGHFGLNLPAYAHWTSPIRRYADLVNQRILHAHIDRKPNPYDEAELEAIATRLNELSDEVRDGGDAGHKEAALNRLNRASETALLRLEQGMFSCFVKWIANETIVLDPMRSGVIKRRIQDSALATLDIGRILFAGTKAQGLWCELKEAALEWLQRNPVEASQLWVLAHGHLGFPPAERIAYARTKDGPDNSPTFSVSASVVHGETEFKSDTFTALTVREAEQLALTSLIAHISQLGNVPIKTPTRSQGDTVMVANAKGQLLEFCQQRRLAAAEFQTVPDGPDHARVFMTVASILLNGQRIESDPCEGASKKQSEQLAAANLLQKLPNAPQAETEAVASGSNGNHIGALMEWCQQQRLAPPTFDFARAGSDNAPVFTCTCKMIIGGTEKVWKAPDTTKKAAKTAAAALACKELLKG